MASLASRLTELQAQPENLEEDTFMSEDTSALVPVDSNFAFFGPHSCVAGSLDQPLRGPETTLPLDDNVLAQIHAHQPLERDTRSHLIRKYFYPLHGQYPILDSGHTLLSDPVWTKPGDASSAFISNIALAIACHGIPQAHRYASSLAAVSQSAYRSAMEHVEEATGDVSVTSLRNMALLSLHALFAPDCGNLHQLIGVALRLCVDLNVQKKRDPSLRRLLLSVLCIERQAGLCFDRPWSLLGPEIISQNNSEPVELLWGILSIACDYRQSLYDNISLPVEDYQACLQPLSDAIARAPERAYLTTELSVVRLILAIDGRCPDQECAELASELLRSYERTQSFHTFLSGHWVFKACETLLKRSPSSEDVRLSNGYQRALMFLDRDSIIWPSYSNLLEILRTPPGR